MAEIGPERKLHFTVGGHNSITTLVLYNIYGITPLHRARIFQYLRLLIIWPWLKVQRVAVVELVVPPPLVLVARPIESGLVLTPTARSARLVACRWLVCLWTLY